MGAAFNHLVFVVLILCCAACAQDPQPLTAQVSSVFDAECLATIEAQSAWWAANLGVASVFELSVVAEPVTDYRTVTVEPKYDPAWVGYASAHYDRQGRLYEGAMWLDPARCTAAKTVAHEIGHILGLGHTDGADDLMNERSATGMRLSEAELSLARVAISD